MNAFQRRQISMAWRSGCSISTEAAETGCNYALVTFTMATVQREAAHGLAATAANGFVNVWAETRSFSYRQHQVFIRQDCRHCIDFGNGGSDDCEGRDQNEGWTHNEGSLNIKSSKVRYSRWRERESSAGGVG
jgi:hypothetical protein